MAKIVGIESTEPANTKMTNGYDLFIWAMRMKDVPIFWARSILQLTPEEIEYLHSKDCKIALIYDELTEAAVSSANGMTEALRAVEIARMLGVPENAGIVLFAAIGEDWSVNHNWMIGYAHTLLENGYMPGFIGNTDSSKNFSFDRECSHYVQVIDAIEQNRNVTVYWATEPQPGIEPDEWTPYSPSALRQDEMNLWRTGEKIYYNDIQVASVSYGRDESIIRYMW